MFKSYQKIHRLGHEENDGILIGLCYVQEKIDGANTSIWLEDDPDGIALKCGSRTRVLENNDFNGFIPFVAVNKGIRELLTRNPMYRLFGEWLVRHTIAYNETAYK